MDTGMTPRLVSPKDCEDCDGTGFRIIETDGMTSAEPCPCRGPATVDALIGAGVPERERGFDAASLSPQQTAAHDRASAELRRGTSVVLFGAAGRGKSGIAVCLLRSMMTDGKRAAWCHVGTWLRELRDTFKREDPELTEVAMLTPLLQADLLVVDDLGAEHLTEWSASMTYAVIDGRDHATRPTVITTNLVRDGKEGSIESIYGERIASRLSRYHWIALKGDDLRSKRRA